jgi:hypothetical protein
VICRRRRFSSQPGLGVHHDVIHASEVNFPQFLSSFAFSEEVIRRTCTSWIVQLWRILRAGL